MDFSSGEAFCLVFFSFTLGLTIVQQLLRARALKTKQKTNEQKKNQHPQPKTDQRYQGHECCLAFAVLMASSINLLPATQCCLAEAFF